MGIGMAGRNCPSRAPSLQLQSSAPLFGGLRAWPGQLSRSQEQHTLRASTDWIAGGRLPLGNPLFLFYLVLASQGFEEKAPLAGGTQNPSLEIISKAWMPLKLPRGEAFAYS